MRLRPSINVPSASITTGWSNPLATMSAASSSNSSSDIIGNSAATGCTTPVGFTDTTLPVSASAAASPASTTMVVGAAVAAGIANPDTARRVSRVDVPAADERANQHAGQPTQQQPDE